MPQQKNFGKVIQCIGCTHKKKAVIEKAPEE
jgi:hypothetical protein